MTTRGYAALTRILMNEADACCKGKMVLTLEGGYNLAALASSIKAVLLELRDETHLSEEDLAAMARSTRSEQAANLAQVIEQIRPYWPVF